MRNVHMCGNSDLTLAECSECDGLEARLTDLEEEVDECCTSVKQTLSEHATELVNLNDDLNALVAEVRSLTGLQVVQVEELPETGQANTIYLVPNGQANDMYMYLEDEWVLVGDTSVDLSGYVKTSDLVDLVYPVGSIYMSVNSVSPQILFGGGTWTQLENRFLLGAGSSYSAGATGGSPNAIVPSHRHHIASFTIGDGAHSHDAGNNQAFLRYNQGSLSLGVDERGVSKDTASGYYAPVVHSPSVDWSYIKNTASATHSHKVGAHYTESTGNNAAGANMPPYLAVYMWKRTA